MRQLTSDDVQNDVILGHFASEYVILMKWRHFDIEGDSTVVIRNFLWWKVEFLRALGMAISNVN